MSGNGVWLWLLAKTTPPLNVQAEDILGFSGSSKSLISQVIDLVDNELGFVVAFFQAARLKHLNFVAFCCKEHVTLPSVFTEFGGTISTQIPTFLWFQDLPVLLKLPRDFWSLLNHNNNSPHQVQLLLGTWGGFVLKKLGLASCHRSGFS